MQAVSIARRMFIFKSAVKVKFYNHVALTGAM
jgi:hypothetical protein